MRGNRYCDCHPWLRHASNHLDGVYERDNTARYLADGFALHHRDDAAHRVHDSEFKLLPEYRQALDRYRHQPLAPGHLPHPDDVHHACHLSKSGTRQPRRRVLLLHCFRCLRGIARLCAAADAEESV